MTSYVIAGYSAVFGVLGLYAYRLVVRSRLAASSVLRHEPAYGPDLREGP